MSNVDINLIRARDGAAPQHKVSNANKFELTEGSDGAQHVKIVDSEGNIQDKISVDLPDRQIVTVDNQVQLPTDYPDKAVEARLQAIEQTQSQILDKLNDTIDTRLTGSIVEEVRIVNALALTDTSSSYHTINIGKYKKIRLYARSTVDSQIMLNIRPFPNTFNVTDFWDGEKWVGNDEIIIPARTQTFYLNSALPWLNDFIGTGVNFRVRVQALDTPTQGNLSVYLLGQVR